MKFFIGVIVGLLLTYVKSAVIGIDFGTNFYKISLIAPGKSFVIVESMASHRKVETALSFVQNKRFYETDAMNKRTRYPTNSFTFIQKFLGAIEENKEVFEVSKEFYDEYMLSFDENRGTVQFELKNFNFDSEDEGTIVLKVEEVMAMILRYAKMLSEKMGKIEIKDCVITVPSGWGFAQRTALLNAVTISGLNPLSLISENTAAGLYYGVERLDVNRTQTVIFYNIGATNVQASLVEYTAVPSKKKTGSSNSTKYVESVNVLADYSIPNIGGIAYDKVIADYFAEQIDEKPERKGKASIKKDKRIMRRMIRECSKTKEVLSANKEALYNAEGLYDNRDFSSHISREVFEERSEQLLAELTKPIDVVLERSGKNLTDVDVVELLGGGSRIPKIQQILQERIGSVELGTHMNGDESMALGASFNGANFSHSFKVRDVLLSDGYNYEFKAVISNLEEVPKDSDQYYYKAFTLFPFKKRYGTKKSVNFANKNNLKIDVFTVDYDGNQAPYAQFNLTNIDSVQKDTHYNSTVVPKVFLDFEISSIDGVTLEDAQVKFNYTFAEKMDEKELKKLEKQKAKNNKKGDKKSKDKKNDKSDGESTATESKSDGESSKIQYKYKNKTRVINIDIKDYYYGVQPMNKTDLKKSIRIVKRFDIYEERQRNLSDIKNKYESFIYQIREWVQDENYIKYTQEDILQKLIAQREEDQEWLDSDEAYNGNITVFQKRLRGLEDLSFPTLRRLEESRLRPEYVNKTFMALNDFAEKTTQLEKTNKWLNATDLAPVKNGIKNITEWLKEGLEKQKDLPLNEDPAFSVFELKPKLEELNKQYLKVRAIPEPKKIEDKKKSKTGKGKKSNKQKIKIDGEDVEIDFEELKKSKEFKDFDFAKFEETLRKQEEQKAKEDAQKADQEQEDINNGEEKSQSEQNQDLEQEENQDSGSKNEQKKDDL